MSERQGHDPYHPHPYGQQPPYQDPAAAVEYDAYGRPVRADVPGQAGPGTGAHGPYAAGDPYAVRPPDGAAEQAGPYAGYDPYGQASAQGTTGPYPAHDPYAAHDPYGAQGPYAAHDPYAGAGHYGQGAQHDPYAGQAGPYAAPAPAAGGYDAYGNPAPLPAQSYAGPAQQQDSGPAQPYAAPAQPYGQPPGDGWIPEQREAPARENHGPAAPPPGPDDGPAADDRPSGPSGADARGGDGGDYRTEQFAFVEERADDSEDVIDWLKFSESRTERREEARRRGRHRVVALAVVLVLVVAGGLGYLWYAGMLPWTGKDGGAAAAAKGERRDVIVVHLRSTDGDGSSTALLVDNGTAKRGTTLLLPNALAVSTEDGGTTTLGKSVEDVGGAPTREALDTLLGSDIKGTWRLDTPYLENLVEMAGGITVTTDTSVPGTKKGEEPLVRQGRGQNLDGRAAVAYSTYRAPGEPQTAQLARFGQVMRATLAKVSTDADAATKTVEALGQIPDPSLSEAELGASLARLSALARNGEYRTEVLPVRANGTLSRSTSDGLVKDVLGGTVKNSDPDAAPRVRTINASGDRNVGQSASVALVNSGYGVVDGGTSHTDQATSQVTYGEAAHKADATEVAKTLGLPAGAVREGEVAGNADVTVVLGSDYKG